MIAPLPASVFQAQLTHKNTDAASAEGISPEDKLARLNRLKTACADIESSFLNELMKNMRRTTEQGGFIKKSAGSDIYDSMAYSQVAVFLSRGSGIGLGQAIFEQMVRKEDLEDVHLGNPDSAGINYSISSKPYRLSDKQSTEYLNETVDPGPAPREVEIGINHDPDMN